MCLLQTWVLANVKCHGLLTPMLRQLVSDILPCYTVNVCMVIEHCCVLIGVYGFVSVYI
jgi:hypothetical protein